MVGAYGDLLFQFGMADENEKAFFDQQAAIATSDIQKKDFYSAFKVVLGEIVLGEMLLSTYFFFTTSSTLSSRYLPSL